ncbi:hypothetical protein SUGI_1199130 [Cryptomeria japonica]|nr:hypothetical protein SUGI_1199130 [Cryptomeria japonica]
MAVASLEESINKRVRKRTQAPRPHSLDDTLCQECGRGDCESEMLLCDKCDKGYHMYCLRPVVVRIPADSWFCPSCKRSPIKEFPLVQTKIIDFFRIRRSSQDLHPLHQESRKRRRRSTAVIVSKKKRRLLPFVPTKDLKRRLQQMGSLATALTSSGVEFSNELTYMPGMAPRSANQAALEKGGMQIMPREDKAALEFCQAMYKRGEWPPLMVVYDSLEGFTVEADHFIKDLTIITEYVGDVDHLRNREKDEGDSMMTLLYTKDQSETLVICPDKRSNIARFINGINNYTPEGRKKQNLKCVRFNVDGEARVLLIAIRDISKGERLYYDYNGYEQEYPTHHFV